MADERAEAQDPGLPGPFAGPPPPGPSPGPAAAALPRGPSPLARAVRWLREYFTAYDPTFWSALAPQMLLSLVLFTRWPGTNYIFDEQEALLANPYVNATGGLRFIDAIHRDFWGLPPDRSVGSYRPIPDFLWRGLWGISKQPFFHHIYNVLFHSINAAILTCIVFAWTRRRGTAYLAGFAFLACAVLTEAVSGIVGIADVLGGMGALLALWALTLPAWAMPCAVFMAVSFGLFCKESALVCVPLVPFAALLAAPLTHPGRPARVARAVLAFVAAAAAFVIYVELRKKWFPSPLPHELTEAPPPEAPAVKRAFFDFLVWFHQAPLPRDPLNNPLVDADTPHRVAGALRVYWRGLTQIVFPRTLSGDYSYPQEPIPDRLVFPESVAGAAMLGLPLLASLLLWPVAMVRERRARRRARALLAAAPPAIDEGAVLLRLTLRCAGLLLFLLAVGALALDLLVLRPQGHLYAVRGLPWTLASVPLGVLGVGLWAEGLDPLPLPDPKGAPVPLGRAGVVLVAVGLVWVVVSFFPHSNIALVLPTVRAERFWYFPAIGSSLVVAVVFAWMASVEEAGLGGARRVSRATQIVETVVHAALLAVLAAGIVFGDWRGHPLQQVVGVLLFGGVGWSLRQSFRRNEEGAEAPAPRAPWLTRALVGAFFLFQCAQGYRHAMNYRDDVTFWGATKDAVPNSAKAHLNYSVMKGARGDLETRLHESKIALALAPKWAMAHVYTGDTLCRLHRADEAWAYYERGFDLGPNELSLIALGLQCLYDEKQLTAFDKQLRALGEQHEGSWIAFLATDTLANGEKNKGVDPKYRPRGYNEGPKD